MSFTYDESESQVLQDIDDEQYDLEKVAHELVQNSILHGHLKVLIKLCSMNIHGFNPVNDLDLQLTAAKCGNLDALKLLLFLPRTIQQLHITTLIYNACLKKQKKIIMYLARFILYIPFDLRKMIINEIEFDDSEEKSLRYSTADFLILRGLENEYCHENARPSLLD